MFKKIFLAMRSAKRATSPVQGGQTLYLPAFFETLARSIDEQGLSYLGVPALVDLMQTVAELEISDTPGVILETGCALGGSSIAITAAKSQQREFYCYDVFGMIPPPSESDGVEVHARYSEIVSGDSVGLKGNVYYGYRENLQKAVEEHFVHMGFSLVENAVTLVKGLYQDTLHVSAPVALAHIDCDWYEPVKLCLERISPHVVTGGMLIIDDYYHYSGCRHAVDEFLENNRHFVKQETKSRLHLRRE